MKTLIFFTLFTLLSLPAFAQVGINNEEPKQALDVKGKVTIGDDGLPPTTGTIRYTEENGFQGYTGNQWKNLISTGPLPSNPVPIYSWSDVVAPSSNIYMTFYDWEGGTYTSVPAGKKFIITAIYPSANSHTTSNFYYTLSIRVVNNSTGFPIFNNNSRIRLSSYDNESRSLMGELSPLFVLKEDETLNVFNYDVSQLSMHISVRGFMVDDLNYE